jgi:broad specificity phosphatase PhoE
MKLILIRHGETTDNAAGILMGHRHGKLSPAGIEQAEKLGERFKNEKIDFIYSSDLLRVKDTIGEITKYHPHVLVVCHEILRECSLGIFEGKHKDEIHRAVLESGLSRQQFRPDGGESRIDFKRRVGKFIKYLLAVHTDNETILVGTHRGWKLSFMCHLLGVSPDSKAIRSLKFDNSSVSIFELKADGDHKVNLLNCTKHLH